MPRSLAAYKAFEPGPLTADEWMEATLKFCLDEGVAVEATDAALDTVEHLTTGFDSPTIGFYLRLKEAA